MNIKKNDTVVVLSGKDRGKIAKVLRALPKKDKVIVEGVRVSKRHERVRKQGQKGQVVEKTMPVWRASVALYCDACKRGIRGRACTKCGKKFS